MSRFKGAVSAAPNNWKSVGLHDAANPEQDPMPVTLYSSGGVEALGPKTGAGSLSVVPATDATFAIAPASGTLTDRSGTIAAGGASQTLAPANASRRYLLVQNHAASSIWVNEGIAAVSGQPSVEILPSQTWEPTGVPTGALYIYGDTTGDAFTCKEL